jgi:hypothetical protein
MDMVAATQSLNRKPPAEAVFLCPEEPMTHEQETEHLNVHVAVCAERYKSLESRLDRIERVMWWMLTTLIMALGGCCSSFSFSLAGRAL